MINKVYKAFSFRLNIHIIDTRQLSAASPTLHQNKPVLRLETIIGDGATAPVLARVDDLFSTCQPTYYICLEWLMLVGEGYIL